MTYDWYKIFALPEFLDSGLVAKTLSLVLESRGRQQFEIFRGNCVSVQHADAFLPIDFLDRNPYIRDTYAVYRDQNDDVWFGFEVEE